METVISLLIHPGIGGSPVIKVCAYSEGKKGNPQRKGKRSKCLRPVVSLAPVGKLRGRKQSQVILVSLLWTQLCRSLLKMKKERNKLP